MQVMPESLVVPTKEQKVNPVSQSREPLLLPPPIPVVSQPVPQRTLFDEDIQRLVEGVTNMSLAMLQQREPIPNPRGGGRPRNNW